MLSGMHVCIVGFQARIPTDMAVFGHTFLNAVIGIVRVYERMGDPGDTY